MLHLHRTGRNYGVTPAQQVGYVLGSWEAFIVNTAAGIIGDEAKAAMTARLKMVFPVVEVG